MATCEAPQWNSPRLTSPPLNGSLIETEDILTSFVAKTGNNYRGTALLLDQKHMHRTAVASCSANMLTDTYRQFTHLNDNNLGALLHGCTGLDINFFVHQPLWLVVFQSC